MPTIPTLEEDEYVEEYVTEESVDDESIQAVVAAERLAALPT